MDDRVRQRLQALTDEDLLRMVDEEREAYTAEALALAEAEVGTRGGREQLRGRVSERRAAAQPRQSAVPPEAPGAPAVGGQPGRARKDLLADRIAKKTREELLQMLAEYRRFPEETRALVRAEVEERGGLTELCDEVAAEGGEVPDIPPDALVPEERKLPEPDAPTLAGGLGLFDGVRTLREETIWEEWHQLVDHGAGRGPAVRQRIMDLLEEARIPGDCYWAVEEVKSSTWISRVRREFLIVDLDQFPDWHMYIGVRDYGIHLDCCRFLTTEPGKIKGWVSAKLADGDREALSKPRNILVAQDLAAWRAIVHSAVLQAVQELMTALGQDISLLERKGRGILDMW